MSLVQLLGGLFNPKAIFYQLEHAETTKGFGKPIFIITIISTLLFVLAAWTGTGSEALSRQLPILNTNEFEWKKALFTIGNGVWGFIFPLIIIFVFSLLFWTLLEVDVPKALGLQLMVTIIYLIEVALLIPMEVYFGLDRASSPFGLGVLAQFATENRLIVNFFGFISLFQLWAIIWQYQFLKLAANKAPRAIRMIVIGLSLAMWAFAALFSSIPIERLF